MGEQVNDETIDKVIEAVEMSLLSPFGHAGGEPPPVEMMIDRRALRKRLEAI